MKYLFITEYFPQSLALDIHGGVEMRTFAIGQELAKKNTVHVITSRVQSTPQKHIAAGIHVHRIGAKRSYTRQGEFWNRLLFMIIAIWRGREVDFDIVEGSSFFGWLPALILGAIKSKPRSILIADVARDYAEDVGSWKLPLFLVERWLFRQKWSTAICISKTVAQKVKSLLAPPTPIIVIYCGVDLQKLQTVKVKKFHTPTICCVARLVPYKRVQDLIMAIGLMKTKVDCQIIGDGDHRLALERLVIQHNLQSQVHLRGFISQYNQVISLIKRSHVFCLPSIVEGFGIATIEALAVGVPAVVADIPIQREVTKDLGVLYFTPKDPIDLAKKLDTLLQNRPLYQKMTNKNYSLLSKYDWEKIAHQTEVAYANLRNN